MSKRCLKCRRLLEEADRQHYGLHSHCFEQWFDLTQFEEFTSLALRSTSLDPAVARSDDGEHSSFFHGQFRKYSAILGNRHYILKVRQEGAPELPDVEYLCNQIAEQLGIPVAPFYCVEFAGERAFVTRNFIDKTEHANLSHIHTHLPQGRKSDCELIIETIADVTQRYMDVETFVLTCLFDSLIGNHDRHGRNLGFIVTQRGSRLAPIYDNPSMLGIHSGMWLEADFHPTGRIPTLITAAPSIKDYVVEFRRLGYSEQVDAFAQRVFATDLITTIEESFCTDKMKTAIKKLIDKRLGELRSALTS